MKINTEAMKKKVREILSKYRQNEGYTMEHAERELLDLFNVSQNTDNSYKKCECGKMKMVGIQCKDPRTGQCDKDTRYIKDFIAPNVSIPFPSDELIEQRGKEFESKTYYNLEDGEKIGDFEIGAKWVVDYLQDNAP